MPTYTINGKRIKTDAPLSDADIDEIASSITPAAAAPAPAAPPPPPEQSKLARMQSRVLPDVAEYVSGVKEMVTHPGQTARTLAGLVEPTLMRLTPMGFFADLARTRATGSPFSREEQAMGNQLFNVVKNPVETVVEHPFQTAMTVLPVVGQVGKVANLPRLTAAAQAASYADPLVMGAGVLKAGGKYVAAPAVDWASNIYTNMRYPERAAGNELFRMTGGTQAGADATLNALRSTQGMPTTPGYTPSLAERVYAGGVSNPTLSATENRLLGASPELNRELYPVTKSNIAALEEQLARIQTRITQQANALSPAAKADLDAVRQSIESTLGSEQAKLAQMEQGIQSRLSGATPQTSGSVLAERGQALKQEAKKTVTGPAYQAAFDLAGDARTDITPLLSAMRDNFPVGLASKITGELNAIAARTARAGVQDPVTGTVRGVVPPNATLKELDALRKALNADISAVRASAASDAEMTARRMSEFHSVLDNVVSGSTGLSAEAKAAYQNALNTYRTEYAPRFKTGVAADLFQDTSKNMPRLLPDDAVRKFLSNETAADQFVTTFRDDAAAGAAMREGVERIYRDTVRTPEQHMAFMRKYGDQINKLDRAGLGLRQHLDSVGEDVRRLAQGQDALAAQAKTLGVESMDKLIDNALGSPSALQQVLKASDAPARSALAQELLRRATQNLEGATQYLKTNADAIKRALQADDPATASRRYSEAVELAKFNDEFRNVKVPAGADANVKVGAELTGKFTDSQLHDLTLVAQDIKRSEAVGKLAGFGRKTASPNPRRLASETAEETTGNVSANLLDARITLARNLFKIATGSMNEKVAIELARVMYRDPDAAIALLKNAAKRQGAKETRRAVYTAPINALGRAGLPGIAVGAAQEPAQ